MSTNIRKIFRDAAVAAALIGTTAPLASEWRTISVRPDDNASRILDAHGVSARTLAALLEQPDIAKRLQLVHVGDTIELFVVDGELQRFRLFDGSRVGLGGRVNRDGEWRTRTIKLNDYGNIAARIRLIEASESQVVGNSSRTEGPQVVLAPSPPPPPLSRRRRKWSDQLKSRPLALTSLMTYATWSVSLAHAFAFRVRLR